MRFLIWFACVTVCLSGLELSLFARDGWRWVWIPMLVLYGFVGVGLCLAGLLKLAAGKLGAGIGTKGGKGLSAIPAPRKDEMER